MPRQRRPGAKRGSPEHRARVSAGLKRRFALDRAALAVMPGDLRDAYARRALPARVRHLVRAVAETMQRLQLAAEGEAGSASFRPLSEPRVVGLEVAGRLLLLALLENHRALTADDGEAASRAGSLLAKFYQLVREVVGLDGREVEIPSLSDYLRQREAAVGSPTEGATSAHSAANGSDPDPDTDAAEIVATEPAE